MPVPTNCQETRFCCPKQWFVSYGWSRPSASEYPVDVRADRYDGLGDRATERLGMSLDDFLDTLPPDLAAEVEAFSSSAYGSSGSLLADGSLGMPSTPRALTAARLGGVQM